MREQMFLLGLAVLGIGVVAFFVIASYLIRRVASEDPAETVKRQLAVAPVVASVLQTYRTSGQKSLLMCPLCAQPIEIRVKSSERLIRLDCHCAACNGTYRLSDSEFQRRPA